MTFKVGNKIKLRYLGNSEILRKITINDSETFYVIKHKRNVNNGNFAAISEKALYELNKGVSK